MGNNAGAIAGCAVGVAGGTAAELAAVPACLPLIAILPAFAACAGGLAIGGVVGQAVGGNQCNELRMMNNDNPPPADTPPPDDGAAGDGGDGARKRRYARPAVRRNFLEFDVMDRNQDGYLTTADMPPFVRDQALKTVLTSLMTYAHVIDWNEDKRISPQELAYFRDMMATDQGAMQMIYRAMDRNRDSQLTPDELVEMTGTMSAMNLDGKPDSIQGCYDTMRLLDKQKKGYVTLQDMQSWYDVQPKPSGYLGLGKYYAPVQPLPPPRSRGNTYVRRPPPPATRNTFPPTLPSRTRGPIQTKVQIWPPVSQKTYG